MHDFEITYAFKKIEVRRPINKKLKKAQLNEEALLLSIVDDQEVEDEELAEKEFNDVYMNIAQNLNNIFQKNVAKPANTRKKLEA